MIMARDLAAALTYLGADVEAALLDLVAVSPGLESRVRSALFAHSTLPQLRYISDRSGTCLRFVHLSIPQWVCVKHAVDFVCQVIEDAEVVTYLQAKFSEYDLTELVQRGERNDF